MISVRKIFGHAAILERPLPQPQRLPKPPHRHLLRPPCVGAMSQWRTTASILQALSTLVDTCATARNLKSCDPSLIGPDDRVPLANGSSTEQRLAQSGTRLAPRVVFGS